MNLTISTSDTGRIYLRIGFHHESKASANAPADAPRYVTRCHIGIASSEHAMTSTTIAVGVASCHPRDNPSKAAARKISLARALRMVDKEATEIFPGLIKYNIVEHHNGKFEGEHTAIAINHRRAIWEMYLKNVRPTTNHRKQYKKLRQQLASFIEESGNSLDKDMANTLRSFIGLQQSRSTVTA